MDGCPLGLGLVVEDKPTEFSCVCAWWLLMCMQVPHTHISYLMEKVVWVQL